MITTIVVHNEIEIKDASGYVMPSMNNIQGLGSEAVVPVSLGNSEKIGDADEKPPK